MLICTEGYAWVEALQQCIQVSPGGDESSCGEGTVWDANLEVCVPSGESVCGEGTVWNDDLQLCVIAQIDGYCGEGTMWDENLGLCVGLPMCLVQTTAVMARIGMQVLKSVAMPIDEGCPGDLFVDGEVNTFDLLTFLTYFGNQCD